MFKIYRPISALLLVASLGSAWNAFASEGTIGETSEVNQQSGKVTGIVADDLGPVAGASVAVKGTSKGTITDSDGKFVLNGVRKIWISNWWKTRKLSMKSLLPPSE